MRRLRLVALLLLLAIGTAAGVHLLLGGGRQPARAAAVAPAKNVPAVVTIRAALPPGHILRPDDLLNLRWANGPLPASAIISGSPEARALAGAVTRRAFAAGELVMPGSVITPGDRGFLAAIVSPGHRAIAVAVDATTAAGGLIWPGDRVDVILTQEIRDDGVPLAQRVVSETILEDVRILSTDQKLDEAGSEPAGGEAKMEPRRVPTTVTVEVTPPEAERVTVGSTLGRLHLTLRGVAGAEGPVAELPATWAGNVSPALGAVRQQPAAQLSAAPSPPRPVAREPAGVRVYRGSGQ